MKGLHSGILDRLKKISALCAGICLLIFAFIVGIVPAQGAVSTDDPTGRGRIGYSFTYAGWMTWLGNQIPSPDGSPQFCIQETWSSPENNETVSVEQVPTASKHIDELALEQAQAAWVLANYGSSEDRDTLAAVSLIMHSNFEIDQPYEPGDPEPPSGYDYSGRSLAEWIWDGANAELPQVVVRAKELVSEARLSSVKGYAADTVEGDGQRQGKYTGFSLQTDSGSFVGGVSLTALLTGPAVWDDTGNAAITLTTSNEGLITKSWTATGNGDVGISFTYKDPSGKLYKLQRESAQDTVKWQMSHDDISGKGKTWRVTYDFQPRGISKVLSHEVSDGIVRDTLVTQVDKGYGDGTWIEVNGEPVPIVYRATAYWAGHTKPEVGKIPANAEPIGTKTMTATGESQKLSASFELTKRGWVTWVWEVRKEDQGSNSIYVYKDWADQYGLDDETSLENFPFRPVGVSHVRTAKVLDPGQHLTDTFVPNADDNFMDGQWTRVGSKDLSRGEYVSVVYRANLYFVSPTVLPTTSKTVPDDAQLIKSLKITAKEPGKPITADAGKALKEGFYTWVWEVRAEDQLPDAAQWIEAGFIDQYGLPDETTSVRSEMQIDSALSIRHTKSGDYLVDDVWVRGLPENHTSFTEASGFKTDDQHIMQKVLFFPEGLAVTEENIADAEQIGDVVSIPAKNGFYSVSDTSWLIKTDKEGKNEPGTYVFISTFDGDDRVILLTTSVTDEKEQFAIFPNPSLHTEILYEGSKNPIPAQGKRELVDKVTYTNLEVGEKYTFTGMLMDKETQKPLVNDRGDPVVSEPMTITAQQANGTIDVTFILDDAALYEGKTIVAFEEMKTGDGDVILHADITDENQTINFTDKLITTATDSEDGDKELVPEESVSITDRVCSHEKNLIPGEVYSITASLYSSDDGQPILAKNGKPATATIDFVPQSPEECAEISIEFDGSKLAGKKVVVFEDVLLGGQTIATHHDLNDKAQTVHFTEKENPPLPATGAALPGLICCAGALIAAGTGIMRFKRR